METQIQKVERLIDEINKVHKSYSVDYFETGKIEKINLSKTISHVPLEHILKYRLNLHESINDYLMKANLANIEYYYRVKTSESIHNKIKRYSNNEDRYPVNNWLNDIFGCRILLIESEVKQVESVLDTWKETHGLKNWYKRDKDGYKGIHIYFKNQSNFYFPWELQIWDQKHVNSNISSHRNSKRLFVDDVENAIRYMEGLIEFLHSDMFLKKYFEVENRFANSDTFITLIDLAKIALEELEEESENGNDM